MERCRVLNLIINGIPSILHTQIPMYQVVDRFKPYYKWNTFNTSMKDLEMNQVLEF